MSLDFVHAEFFNGRNLGVAPNINSPSSSSITPSSNTLSEAFKLEDHKYTGVSLAFPTLSSAEHRFAWGENLIMSTDGTIEPAQMIQDPSMPLVQELIQRSDTHSPAIFPQEGSPSFVMTCPLPLCSHQSSELISIWRHITWDHLGDRTKCSRAMTELVEKVVLGVGEK